MKEIGGYLELDRQNGPIYHEGAVAVNCGRAALEYLIRAKKIQKIYLPYFCCDSIAQPCRRCGIEAAYYSIGPDLRPVFSKALKPGEWLYIVNYYGQLSNAELQNYKKSFGRVIVDNAQAYFQMPVENTDTIYTCRKFFGVPDGAFLYTESRLENLPQDESFDRIHYVLGRFERDGNAFYAESQKNNHAFQTEPLKRMSRLTENLLRALDYEACKQRRTANFSFLHQQLGAKNPLTLQVPDGAFMYPFYAENGGRVRKTLQTKKIYIPTLWPDVLEQCGEESLEYQYAENILPLPVDQRYDLQDMAYVVSEVMKCID